MLPFLFQWKRKVSEGNFHSHNRTFNTAGKTQSRNNTTSGTSLKGPKCKDESCGRDSDENCGGYCEICWEKYKHKSPKRNDGSSPTLVKSKETVPVLDHTPSAAKGDVNNQNRGGQAPGGAAPPQYELPAPSPMMATAPLPEKQNNNISSSDVTGLNGIVPQLPQYNSQYPSEKPSTQTYPSNNPPAHAPPRNDHNGNTNMAPPPYSGAPPAQSTNNNFPTPTYGPPAAYSPPQPQQQQRYQPPPAQAPQYTPPQQQQQQQYPPPQQQPQYSQYPPQQQQRQMVMMQQPPPQGPAANVRCPTCSAPLYLQPHQTSAKCPTCNTAFMRPGVVQQQPVMMTQPGVVYQQQYVQQPPVVVMQPRPVQRSFADGLGLGMIGF